MSSENKKGENDKDKDKDKLVTIHIDGQQKQSPNPTSGSALHVLGAVKAGYDLFREVPGKGDDEPIANSEAVVLVKNGDRFYSAQQSLNPGAAWM